MTSPPPPHVRVMAIEDLDQVMAIERAAFPHPWSENLFRQELSHPWSTLLVAESASDANLLGFMIYWLIYDETHILNIATPPSARRRGVAKRLLAECLARVRAASRFVTLEVRRSNTAAIALYESFGFRRVGIRRGYYEQENEDAFVMTLTIPRSL